MPTAITIENVSKLYRLGQVGTGTLAHDLNRWWARLRGKTDPFARVGQENNREQAGGDYVWALRDINLEVQQGEILGIIGKNGAGKSTLLKLLSRVTAPTSGRIVAEGRMASLLEVGTGFHPELTGRENIFLNGAILGMTRVEIKKQFDDIVEFSGCAKYIDTPVKRYSSGMYVRLAFAVAAHLEPEILIVDEVLAVGDADFQARCIGKMEDVSKHSGRTILFVSHNMASVKQLCTRAVWVDKGRLAFEGKVDSAVERYLSKNKPALRWEAEETSSRPELREIEVVDDNAVNKSVITTASKLRIKIEFFSPIEIKGLQLSAALTTSLGDVIFASSLSDAYDGPLLPGKHTCVLAIPDGVLMPRQYGVRVVLWHPLDGVFSRIDSISFLANQYEGLASKSAGGREGMLAMHCNWTCKHETTDTTCVDR